MVITVLVCLPDGTQTVEQREVAEDWFGTEEDEAGIIPPETSPSQE